MNDFWCSPHVNRKLRYAEICKLNPVFKTFCPSALPSFPYALLLSFQNMKPSKMKSELIALFPASFMNSRHCTARCEMWLLQMTGWAGGDVCPSSSSCFFSSLSPRGAPNRPPLSLWGEEGGRCSFPVLFCSSAAGHTAWSRDAAARLERELRGEFLITRGSVGPGCLGDGQRAAEHFTPSNRQRLKLYCYLMPGWWCLAARGALCSHGEMAATGSGQLPRQKESCVLGEERKEEKMDLLCFGEEEQLPRKAFWIS